MPIPPLGLHGNNRNEDPDLCVMCHNPNQTDVPYRLVTTDPLTSAAEVSADFKRMVHGIHAGEFRTQPLIAVGFDTSLHDHRDLRFPGKLRDCTRCHDKSEVRSHMVRTGGASLSALQQDIGTRVVERCDNCHGPGTDKSVRKAHEIGSSGGSGDD